MVGAAWTRTPTKTPDPRLVVPGEAAAECGAALVGDKALSLARLSAAGLAVPPFIVVTTAAYEAYLAASGLRPRILFELNRKDFADMRWEELWDAALRIRNLFLTTEMPTELGAALAESVTARFGDRAVCVRSSSPGEDSAASSFAGLHESFVNVRGAESVLDHLRLVWASLWSDAALLYRRELGLDPRQSAMAVVVQEIVAGDRSGVAFSRHPDADRHALIEAVHGLNQGLVDGLVEPDHWTLDRRNGAVLAHHEATRREMMAAGRAGVRLVPLPHRRRAEPPLSPAEVPRVFALAQRAEPRFAAPQDVEWTIKGDRLYTLQSRPITTLTGTAGDGRAVYLGHRRSLDSLLRLRRRIEDEDIPALVRQADRLAGAAVAELDDAGLVAALRERKAAHDRGVDMYVADFIPFAHAVRLFGRAYNDALRPDDPYEFTDLLVATPMVSLRRNAALNRLAATLRDGDARAAERELALYLEEFGAFGGAAEDQRAEVLAVARRLAGRPAAQAPAHRDPATLLDRFIEAHSPEERQQAAQLVELGRASWRLRDDDNLYLDRLERLVLEAIAEAERRGLSVDDDLRPRTITLPSPLGAASVAHQPTGEADAPPTSSLAANAPATASDLMGAQGRPQSATANSTSVRRKARQIVGQPAGPGLAVGPARVVHRPEDLSAFADGEILVCDALRPGMTYVVLLAAGIVERRGGMLIHGAIIAREYGLPCVTGIPRATELIRTGDRLTVDGYLGIVVID